MEFDIPKRIIKETKTISGYYSNGYEAVWLDLEAAVGEAGYGCWFPEWKVHPCKSGLYATLTVEDFYYRQFDTKRVDCVYIIEHKEKVQGKKFKRYKYTAQEFVDLLSAYQEETNKLKAFQSNRVLARYGKKDKYGIGYIYNNKFHDLNDGAKGVSKFTILCSDTAEIDRKYAELDELNYRIKALSFNREKLQDLLSNRVFYDTSSHIKKTQASPRFLSKSLSERRIWDDPQKEYIECVDNIHDTLINSIKKMDNLISELKGEFNEKLYPTSPPQTQNNSK